MWSEMMRGGERAARKGYWIAALATLAAIAAQPARADRNTLWNVVNLKCLRHLAKSEAPIPCDSVDVSAGWDRGVALLKDATGAGRMLAIPTRVVTGIEDPALLARDEPNYFALAWSARTNVAFHLRQTLPREAIAITVNSLASRDQDQLNLSIDCVDKDVSAALASSADAFDAKWRPVTVAPKGRPYWVRRLDSDDFADQSPFRMLADEIDGAKAEMGLWSLAAIGANFAGKPGFILLADRADATATSHIQDLQDRDCAIAKPKI
jgi:CDP-diacylglycerol pyrophosphatase